MSRVFFLEYNQELIENFLINRELVYVITKMKKSPSITYFLRLINGTNIEFPVTKCCYIINIKIKCLQFLNIRDLLFLEEFLCLIRSDILLRTIIHRIFLDNICPVIFYNIGVSYIFRYILLIKYKLENFYFLLLNLIFQFLFFKEINYIPNCIAKSQLLLDYCAGFFNFFISQ